MQKLKKNCPRAIAILLSLMMMVVFVPTIAFADDDPPASAPFVVTSSNEGVVEIGEYLNEPVYYVSAPEGTKQVQFTEFGTTGTMITNLNNEYLQKVEDNNIAPVGGYWRVDYDDLDDAFGLNTAADDLDFSNAYYYFVTDDDDNWVSFVVAVEEPPVVIPDITFTASANGVNLTEITKEDDAYTFYPMSGDPYLVPVYTVAIPLGVNKVDLTFSENVIAYNYSSAGEYLDGYYTNFMEGSKTGTVPVNANVKAIESAYGTIEADAEFDIIQVQTPYDASWNSYMPYGISFKYAAPAPLTIGLSAADFQKGVKASLPANYKWTAYPTVKPGKVATGKASFIDPAVGIEVKDITANINAEALKDLPAVKITKAKKAKKAFTVKWKKVSKKNKKKIGSIQVQYSLNSNFDNAVTKTVKKTKTTLKVKKLNAKTTYYVRVRAYKEDNVGIHVSAWSKVKKVKTKK